MSKNSTVPSVEVVMVVVWDNLGPSKAFHHEHLLQKETALDLIIYPKTNRFKSPLIHY